MTYTLNYDDVVRELRALAAERPDFVYHPETEVDENGNESEHYRYCHQDGPGCIVGHVVAKLLPDFPLSNLDIDPADNDPDIDDSGTAADRAIPRNGIEINLDTLTLLRRVQTSQDMGTAWSAAVGSWVDPE